MKRIIIETIVAVVVLLVSFSSAKAVINISVATVQNGFVHVEGDQAPRRQAISWEGSSVGISSNSGGAFQFNTTDLPEDCVGTLEIGSETREVVINNCTPVAIIEAGVPKTGQTTSFAAGDDGDLEKGVPLPVPRFTENVNAANDNGAGGGIAGTGICDGTETCNGTVTDHLTALIWLKNANCFGQQTWANLTSANTLDDGECGLTDGSVEGDWRLPNVRELQSLVDYGTFNPSLPALHPFTNFPALPSIGRLLRTLATR